MMYRFESTAEWHKRILSKGGEQVRGGVAGVSFACFEKYSSKSGTSHRQGTENKTVSIVLQTADDVALKIEAGDNVIYGGIAYTVKEVGTIRSMAYKGAKEYTIALE